jgi:hypothetical protein
MNKNKNLSPVGVLIDELKSEDPKRRMNSVKNFTTIASAIGPERTRSELLPFVSGMVLMGLSHLTIELLDDEDDVLLELAEALGNLLDYIGGNQFAYLLLNPLEKLCFIEDVRVREKVNLVNS